jgi:hypothetical protein
MEAKAMPTLKLTGIPDDKPVKIAIDLPAAVFRDLTAYAEAIGREGGQSPPEPVKLIVPMLQRFIASDRAFAALRRTRSAQGTKDDPDRSG